MLQQGLELLDECMRGSVRIALRARQHRGVQAPALTGKRPK